MNTIWSANPWKLLALNSVISYMTLSKIYVSNSTFLINKMHLIFVLLCNFTNQGLLFVLMLGLCCLLENNSHHTTIRQGHTVFCNQAHSTTIHSLISRLDLALIFGKVWQVQSNTFCKHQMFNPVRHILARRFC